MSDNQWPRWEVFKKDSDRKPFQAVGSVHAADADHALLNARNVFVRRPAAVNLWVVPAAAIYARTAEQLALHGHGHGNSNEEGQPAAVAGEGWQAYEIFCKSSHRRSMTFMDHLGQVEAPSPAAALRRARAQFSDIDGLAWWIVPTAEIAASGDDPEVVAAWFEPAKGKTYKQQSAYGFVSAARRRRLSAKEDQADE